MKHGGIAKKGGEKNFKGRVKDHKKRLWYIHVAIWLFKSMPNDNVRRERWLMGGGRRDGLKALLASKVKAEEKLVIQGFVRRELRTLARYVTQRRAAESDASSYSAQTWPPPKKIRTPVMTALPKNVVVADVSKGNGDVPEVPTLPDLSGGSTISSPRWLVHSRIPAGLRWERLWLEQAAQHCAAASGP